MKVIKRNGEEVVFDKNRIVNAVSKANAELEQVDDVHTLSSAQIRSIADMVEKECLSLGHAVDIETIQELVEKAIMGHRGYEVAQLYIRYRYKKDLKRKSNTTDGAILSLVDRKNEEVMQENSNKNPIITSVQRDYIAGEVSKDISSRILLPEDVVKAHKDGVIHFHDMDYFLTKMTNCCLVNLEDMLQNGTVISGRMIESPKSFLVACNTSTQFIAQIASSQYGGQSVSLAHLAPFVEVSRKKIRARYKDSALVRKMKELHVDEEQIQAAIDEEVEQALKLEISQGCQTIQYQIETLMTTNGQTPFVTLFMCLSEAKNDRERADLAMIIEEILTQRIKGIKNEQGVLVTPAFPKLIYVLDEYTERGREYEYLSAIAAKCTAKRMVPDYISAKKMRELKDGNVYPCMGCVDGREIITYRIDGQTYMESFERAWTRLARIFTVKVQPGRVYDKYIDCDGVEIYDTKNGFTPCYRFIRNIQNKWMQVTLQNGRTIRCTDNHPFETENRGVVLAKDLTKEDIIAINRESFITGDKKINSDFAWLLGVLLCDGCYDRHLSVSLAAQGEDDIASKTSDCFNQFFELDTHVIRQNRGAKGKYIDIYANSDGTARLQNACSFLNGLFGGKQKIARCLPNDILTWNRKAMVSFLAGMIDADGYINSNPATSIVQLGSTNKELALGQMYLAQALGMPARIYENHYRYNCKDSIRYRVEFVPTNELLDVLVCMKKKEKAISIERKNKSSLSDNNSHVAKIEFYDYDEYSYDVTTESEHFEVSGIYSHNCRSFLTVDRCSEKYGNIANALNYEPGKKKFYGRFNQGVVTINLVDVACSSARDMDKFWEILEDRLELCHRALRARHERLLGTPSDVAPILWQHGALARLKKGETIDKLLYHGYSTLSLGYAGLYEMCVYMTGKSHTDDEAKPFALKVMQKLNDKCEEWKKAEDIDYSVYGTPLESTTYKFAKCLQKRFGIVEGVTDHNYITNSYHVNVREEIDAFTKLKFESEFQRLSPGGAISYVEVPNLTANPEAIRSVMDYIYDTIMYAELNTKSDYCMECGYDGEIQIVEEDGKLLWECPKCGNRDQLKMSVARRTCGYIGTQFWNQGRTQEIRDRVMHL